MFGVVLAFVPIEGRPADIMVIHFVKALFSPTQFMYQKTALPKPITASVKAFTPTPVKEPEKKSATVESEQTKKIHLESIAPIAKEAVQQQEKVEPKISAPIQPVAAPAAPSAADASLQKEVQHLASELAEAKAQETQAQQGTTASIQAHEKVTDLEKELQEITQQKQALESQLVALQKSLAEKKQQVFTPSTAAPAQETQHVKKVTKQMGVGIGVPLVPDVPNLVTGVIKDSRGNVLANMLIEIKDKDNNPVRAFKTNQLGQFASATPLMNGTYTMSFEDPAGKHTFDSVELITSGEILLPLEITSVDAREKLRQELFGATT